MVINPGAAFGFEIDPEGVANIRRDFKPTDEPATALPTRLRPVTGQTATAVFFANTAVAARPAASAGE